MRDSGAFSAGKWALHGSVLAIVIVAEAIGTIRLPIGIATVILLPMLYAFALGIIVNPNILKATSKVITPRVTKFASGMITIAIAPFVAKFGTTVGPQIQAVIDAGPSLILQEIGNLGTIVIAFPIAVYVLKMG